MTEYSEQTFEWFERFTLKNCPWWARHYKYFKPYHIDPMRRADGFMDCHIVPHDAQLGTEANTFGRRLREAWTSELESMGTHERVITNDGMDAMMHGGMKHGDTPWCRMLRRIACHVWDKPNTVQSWIDLTNEFRHNGDANTWRSVIF